MTCSMHNHRLPLRYPCTEPPRTQTNALASITCCTQQLSTDSGSHFSTSYRRKQSWDDRISCPYSRCYSFFFFSRMCQAFFSSQIPVHWPRRDGRLGEPTESTKLSTVCIAVMPHDPELRALSKVALFVNLRLAASPKCWRVKFFHHYPSPRCFKTLGLGSMLE